MTGGYGFGPDHRLKTAASLSALWDGAGLRRVRSIDGVTDLRGRRLALHLMVQPQVAVDFLSDEILRDQGLLSRILVAAPVSMAGTRMFTRPDAECDAAIRNYTFRLLRLFEVSPNDRDRPNELSPRPLAMSEQARQIWIDFYNHVEAETCPGQSLAELRDVAGKAAELAARIAGVLTIVLDPAATEITGEAMQNGIKLETWHLNEAIRLAGSSRINPKLRDAQAMLDWLIRRDRPEISIREAQQFGPNRLRDKYTITQAFTILADHGWLQPHPTDERRWVFVSESGA
jgi:hypothetical protein